MLDQNQLGESAGLLNTEEKNVCSGKNKFMKVLIIFP